MATARPRESGTGLARQARRWRRRESAQGLPDGCFIRPARARDAAALGRILSDWIDETPWMPRIHSRQQDRVHAGQVIRTMSVSVLCQRRGLLPARPIGFLARREHFIHALYLAPEARARGLGGALMAEAKRAAPRLELWCFQANLPARAFYRKHGFSVAEFGDGSGNDEGLPDLRLCWSPV